MNNTAQEVFRHLFELGSKAFKLTRDEAIAPEKTKKLKDWGITEAALMIGRSTQTLRTMEEAEKIPKARQVLKGKRYERIYNLKEINFLREHFGTRPSKPKDVEAAIIGFVNFKGGAGKTTSAIGSAQYFAKQGYKVLLIDCDSQGSSTQMFGYIPDEDLEDKETILNILTGETEDLTTLIKKTYWDGLDLIPANLSLYNAELIIPTQIADYQKLTGKQLNFYNRLNKSLKDVTKNYDIVILDCPPSLGMLSINAIFAATALIITMPPVIIDFASTIQFFKMVSEVMERLPTKIYSFVRILLTKYNGRSSANQLKDLMKAFFGQFKLTENMIESEAISKAATNMQTLYEIDGFISDKRTYERAIQQADRVNEEIHSLIQSMWEKNSIIPTFNVIESEVIE